jgi:hypothetical protein
VKLTFQEKVALLRKDLAARGEPLLWAENRALKMAWRLGVPVRPTLFWGPFFLFSYCMGGMAFFYWLMSRFLPLGREALVGMLLTGAILALVFSTLSWYERKRMGMPAWRNYGKQ